MKIIDPNHLLNEDQKKKARKTANEYIKAYTPGFVRSAYVIPSNPMDELRIHLYYHTATGRDYHEIFIWSVGDVWAIV